MTDSNPYSPPTDLGAQRSAPPLAPTVNSPAPGVVDALRRTRPWALFLAILGFIGGGLMAIVTLIMVVGSFVEASDSGGGDAPIVIIIAASFAVTTAMGILLSAHLFRYARSIGYLVQFNRNDELVETLEAQRGFWKTAGIAVVVLMALSIVGSIAGIAVAVAMGL